MVKDDHPDYITFASMDEDVKKWAGIIGENLEYPEREDDDVKNRELVQLAQVFDPAKHPICGMFASEKLDGQRALWLPETVGIPIEEIYWANPDALGRRVVSTGLWSRLGHVIHAPLWWIGRLPKIPLDGELYLGVKRHQELMGITKRLPENSLDWKEVRYKVYDSPSHVEIYREGRIYGQHYKTKFLGDLPLLKGIVLHPRTSFEAIYYYLKSGFPEVDLHEQVMTPYKKDEAEAFLTKMMTDITLKGGEGIILRNPSSIWDPIRTPAMVKIKPYHDSEAEITGFTMGKGKYKGMLGALVVKWNGIRFELSGMTDRERQLMPRLSRIPESESHLPIGCESKFFSNGTIVTFRYRELSDGGIPKEARYLRIKEPE